MPLSSYKSLKSLGRKGGARKAAQHPAISYVSMFSMSSFDAERDLPIVYCDNYNIRLFGVELFHQFDSKKYRKLAQQLSIQFLDTRWARHLHHDEQSKIDLDSVLPAGRSLRFLRPSRPINMIELRNHHMPEHLAKVHEDKSYLSRVYEVWLLNMMPQCLLESRLIDPIKWQISGTVFAANLAMQHGWAINLGGGFHAASATMSENFCLFSDVMLAIRYIWRKHPLQKFLIIDLDAHQAIGLGRDLARMPDRQREMIFLLDVFNNTIQLADTAADEATNLRIELGRFTGDQTYLTRLQQALDVAHNQFKPSLVIYIAGQDVLKDDRLGLMNLSDAGLFKRDEMVFRHAVEQQKCPIVMLLAGGYLTRATHVQAQSIRRLFSLGLIWGGHRSGSRTLTRPRMSPQTDSTGSPTNTSPTDTTSNSTPSPQSMSLKQAATEEQNQEEPASPIKSHLPSQRAPDNSGLSKKSLDTIGTRPIAQTEQHTGPPQSQGFAVLLKKTFTKTLKTLDGLEHPVDAISESVSTSGGLHRVRKVVRVGPKAAHITKLLPIEQAQKSHKSMSQRRRLELTKKTVTEAMRTKTNPNKEKE